MGDSDYKVPITKAGKGIVLEVDIALIDDVTLKGLIIEGLKACLNSKMASVGAVTKLEGDALAAAQAKAMTIAKDNLEALMTGKFKFAGQKAKAPVKREVQNEAIRLAREFVRDQIRAQGYTISHFSAKDITTAAKGKVEADPSFYARAEENLAKNAAIETKIDLSALGLKPDPEKLAKAEAAKVTRAQNLSKTQAGKTLPRTTKSKPKATPGDILAGIGHGPGASSGAVHH
jgi:hypothetical protein